MVKQHEKHKHICITTTVIIDCIRCKEELEIDMEEKEVVMKLINEFIKKHKDCK